MIVNCEIYIKKEEYLYAFQSMCLHNLSVMIKCTCIRDPEGICTSEFKEKGEGEGR